MSETSDSDTSGLKSRFSVSTVGSPRPGSASMNTYNYRDSYAPYPLPVSPLGAGTSANPTPPHVVARRRRQQEKERRTLSLQTHHASRQGADQKYRSTSDHHYHRIPTSAPAATSSSRIRDSKATSISARDSFVHFSDSDSSPSSPLSPSSPASPPPSSPSVYSVPSCESHKSSGTGSGSGSGSGHSCPPTPNAGTRTLGMDVGVKVNGKDMNLGLKIDSTGRRGSANSDDANAYLCRPSSFTIGLPTPASRTPSVYLPASSLPTLADLAPESAPSHRTSFALPLDSISPSRASSLVIRTGRNGRRSDDLRRLTVQDLREQDLTYLDDLDGVDNRPDREQIIAQRLDRNSLLLARRASVLSNASLAASVYSQGTVRSFPGAGREARNEIEKEEENAEEEGNEIERVDPNRLSVMTCASAYTYATSRASVQTYGSSVLTYGSLASRPQSPTEDNEASAANAEGGESRPAHPLPWDPRPSAVSRISRQKRGPRPLPPLPAKKVAASPGATTSNTNGTMKKKPRPLPRPPSQAPPLADISEVPTSADVAQVAEPTIYNTSSAANSSSVNRGSRRRSRRYSALASAFGHPGRRVSIGGMGEDGDPNVGLSRASSMSVRTGFMSVSGCEVPDVDELVRLLYENEPEPRKTGRSRIAEARRHARKGDAYELETAPTSPLSPGALDMGDALEDTRGCVALPGGGLAQALMSVPNIGLPTPAATPKPRTPPKVTGRLPDIPALPPALVIPPPPSVVAPKPELSGSNSAQTSLLSPPDANCNRLSTLLAPSPQSSLLYSPGSGVSAPSSHLSFPLPPEEFEIPGPSIVDARDVPVPAKDDGEMTPSTGVRLSFAEKATLPGLNLSVAKAIFFGKRETASTPPPPPVPEKPAASKGSPGKHTSTQDAIADLRNRVSILARSLPIPSLPIPLNPKPSISAGIQLTRPRGASASEYLQGVPRLMMPVPPRRRATSSATHADNNVPPVVPEKDNIMTVNEVKVHGNEARHPYAAAVGLPKIDVNAANKYGAPKLPPSSFKIPASGDGTGSFSAPPVAPLRFRNSRRGSELGIPPPSSGLAAPTMTPGPMSGSSVIGIAPSSGRPSTADTPSSGYSTSRSMSFRGSSTPATTIMDVSLTSTSSRPATADAATTSFTTKNTGITEKPQRSASISAPSAPVFECPPVAPLKLKSNRSSVAFRMRSSTFGGSSSLILSSQEKPDVKQIESHTPALVIPEEPREDCGTNISTSSVETSVTERRARLKADLVDNEAIGPELARIIHSIADDPDTQMGSLLTIASSINSEKHDFDFDGPSAQKTGENDVEEEEEEEGEVREANGKRDRLSVASVHSDKRKSKGRSVTSIRRLPSTRSSRRASRDNLLRKSGTVLPAELKNLAPVDPEALKALPDPNTFPIPIPSPGVLDSTPEVNSLNNLILRPSPLPKLKIVTKFKGDTVLLPSSKAPLSAVSTKSAMSTMSTMSGVSALGNAVGLGSGPRGPRKMNRLTLTDPRSPMTDAAAAAAALVERFKQKRAAIAQMGPQGGIQRRHQRNGSKDGRGRIPLTGSGFFGSSVRAFPDPISRSARPSIRRVNDLTSIEVERSSDLLLE